MTIDENHNLVDRLRLLSHIGFIMEQLTMLCCKYYDLVSLHILGYTYMYPIFTGLAVVLLQSTPWEFYYRPSPTCISINLCTNRPGRRSWLYGMVVWWQQHTKQQHVIVLQCKHKQHCTSVNGYNSLGRKTYKYCPSITSSIYVAVQCCTIVLTCL